MADSESTSVGQTKAAVRHAAAIFGKARDDLEAFDLHVADTQKRMATLGLLGIVRNLEGLKDGTRSLRGLLDDTVKALHSLSGTLAAIAEESAPQEVVAALEPAVLVIEDAGDAKPVVGTELVRLRQQVGAKLRGGSPQLLLHRVDVMRQACMQAFGLIDTAKNAADQALRTATTAGASDDPSGLGRSPASVGSDSAERDERVTDPPGVYTRVEVNRVRDHLSRPELDHSPANDAMIDVIGQGIAEGRELSEGERYFMRHELTEARLMDDGMSYEDAHDSALRTHPLMKNYTPEVIDGFPELFNNNWRRAWGMEPR